MPHAAVMFRPTISYRRDAFMQGLARHGYETGDRSRGSPEPGDLLVIWNRRAHDGRIARLYDRAGARVVVAENGYVGADQDGHKLYALALDHHNGAGSWKVGGPERWESFGVEVKPWRATGSFLLVLPQRGIGEPGVAMPPTWARAAMAELQHRSGREVRLRRHPGADKTDPYEALQGAHAAVTWGSGAAIKALVAGYPVFYGLPEWIGAPAAAPLLGADLDRPFMGDRMPMLTRLAWAQWRLSEIESGEAFEWLLGS